MTFLVSKLASVKQTETLKHYVYIFEPGVEGPASRWLNDNVTKIGKQLGAEAAVVRGEGSEISDEFTGFLRKHMKDEEFQKIDDFFSNNIIVAVTKEPLPHAGEMFFIPVCELGFDNQAD